MMKIQLNPVQAFFLSIFLTGTSFVVPQSVNAASTECHHAMKVGQAPAWRQAPGDLFMGFRSNAAHFWHWIHGENFSALNVEGIVIGDGHIMNFRDIPLENGKRQFGLVDIDDAGVGSLLADFMRYHIGNQLSPFKVSNKELWQAYIDGLNNVRYDKPEVIKKAENKVYGLQEHLAFVDKNTSQKRFNENAELASLADADLSIKELFKHADPIFRNELSGEILDIGYKINDDGGSQGLVRFWYLVKEHKVMHIYEFKQEPAPAPASYGPQPPRTEAFTQAAALYRPANPSGQQKMLAVKSGHFLMRERQKAELNFDPSKAKEKTIAQGKEVSLYTANEIGLSQLAQTAAGEALKAELRKDPQAYEKFITLTEKYITKMTAENR